jgi:serine/threonine protein kinase
MPLGSVADVLTPEGLARLGGEWNSTGKQIVLLGIASGMLFMHDHRFIHRDLKPANVLLDGNFEPKISGFGLSKCVPLGQSLSQSMAGDTIPFMAPEIHSEGSFGFKADVYAFGILLYMW